MAADCASCKHYTPDPKTPGFGTCDGMAFVETDAVRIDGSHPVVVKEHACADDPHCSMYEART
jgi:hypothetical protein